MQALKNRFYFVVGGRIRIPFDRMPQFIELNTKNNTASFDVNYIRIVMLMVFGVEKIKKLDFQPDVLDLMKGKYSLFARPVANS